MADRRPFSINRIALAVLWLGMGMFVVIHSALIVSRSFGDPTDATFRIAWFLGLGFVVMLFVYFETKDSSITD